MADNFTTVDPTGSLLGVAPADTNPVSLFPVTTARINIHDLTLSEQGGDFIKGWEGVVKTLDGTRSFYYNDDSGYCTVGWGHLTGGRSNCTSQNIRGTTPHHHIIASDVQLYDSISIIEAQQLFDTDKRSRGENIVKKDVKVPLFQYEFDALCSLVYNGGRLSILAPTLLQLLNAGDYINAPLHMLDINKSNGVVVPSLTLRRRREYDIFTKQIYNSQH